MKNDSDARLDTLTTGRARQRLPEASVAGSIGAFAVSVILHGIVLLAVGGYVIFEGVLPKSPFVEVPLSSSQEEEVLEIPEPDEVMATPDAPSPETELSAVSQNNPGSPSMGSMEVISSTASNPVFSIVPAATLGPASNQFSVAAASSQKSENATAKSAFSSPRSMSSLFGSREQSGDALLGTLYDLKQTVEGKPTEMAAVKGEGVETNHQNQMYFSIVSRFVERGWDSDVFQSFFKAPKVLATYMFFIPRMSALEAPKAFDVEKEVEPRRWVIHYKGSYTAPVTGKVRFVGRGDDILLVRFNRRDVFDGSLMPVAKNVRRDPVSARMNDGQPGYQKEGFFVGGNWFELQQGQTYPVEVLIGEQPGGVFYSILMVQEEGKSYPERPDDAGPLLPVFQMVPTRLPRYDEERTAPTVAKDGFGFGSR